MLAIVTPLEMAGVDARATEPVEVLIERAGTALAWSARRMLGGTYGRRVVVVAGKGNNGADGRVAARLLGGWGVRVQLLDAADAPSSLPRADLIIDAAYGTGLGRAYTAPSTSDRVLAVDIASGVDGLTGERRGQPMTAERTVTFQALKPGLVLSPGADHTGVVEVIDLGLDVSQARAHLVEAADVASWLPTRPSAAHKWQSACWVIAGSPGMTGAATMAAAAAARGGAGYVRLSSPGVVAEAGLEVVSTELSAGGWAQQLDDVDRFGAMVLGPGLGRGPGTTDDVLAALGNVPTPVVLDGDGLAAIEGRSEVLARRSAPTVLTPHDREFEYLCGRRPRADRFEEVREAARLTGSVVLLKGPCTLVADPDGTVLAVTSGDARLATAGTGDVLAGLIGALLARGVPALRAAAAAAWIHGAAARNCHREGFIAPDLLTTIPEILNASDLG